MGDPLIILAPPHSFTSVVCAMIGQHPQMYDLPEVNLFVAETMRERSLDVAWSEYHQHGLLRVVAQLIEGEQTPRAILLAQRWIHARADRTCVSVFEELAEKVRPRILADKSPRTTMRCEYMQRVKHAFPNAKYLHLLRDPRSHVESRRRTDGFAFDMGDYSAHLSMRRWYSRHINIITFLDGLPSAQKLRVRGEDLLGEPDAHLRMIAGWLDVRTDEEAIEAMKHPERSPYACFGPVNARFGNNPGFQRSPALRRGSPKPSRPEEPAERQEYGIRFSPEVEELAREFSYI
jgi:Sulfotransferase family